MVGEECVTGLFMSRASDRRPKVGARSGRWKVRLIVVFASGGIGPVRHFVHIGPSGRAAIAFHGLWKVCSY